VSVVTVCCGIGGTLAQADQTDAAHDELDLYRQYDAFHDRY